MIDGQEVNAAMKLQDLYYGNITPCEHSVKSESEYAKRTRDLLEGFRDCAELIIDVMFGRSDNLK